MSDRKMLTFGDILGSSPLIASAISLAARVAPTDATVLLLGETGTGKDVFAQAIHQASHRSKNPFVALNITAFSKELLESQLFGYMAGAFTGASKSQKGLLETADKGTLFLDEIGDMDFGLQAKLLRVLETGEFLRVGGTNPLSVSFRVIAATNRDLEQDVQEGRFRDDLYYRLNRFAIALPALRDRKEDIPVLTDYFVKSFAAKTNSRIQNASLDFLDQLRLHDWRGNIRELKNIMERSIALAGGEKLYPADLPSDFRNSLQTQRFNDQFDLASAEKRHIQRVLQHTGGNKAATARLLRIGLTTLYRKISKYRLPDQY